jgi:tetratricopeptide (TPR) repeat protein
VNCGSAFDDKKRIASLSRKSLYVVITAFFAALAVVIALRIDFYASLEEKRSALKHSEAAAQKQMPAELKHLHEKIALLEAEAALHPDEVSKLAELANSYFDIGNFRKAVFYYKKVLNINPEDADILIDTGVSFFNLSQSDTAIFYLKKAIAVNPQHRQGLYNLGIIYYNLGRIDDAVDIWNRLILLNGGSKEARNARKFIEQIEKQSKSL